jgi:hypothetical protein
MSIIISLWHYFRILEKELSSTDIATYSKITTNTKRINGDEYTLKLMPTEKCKSTDFFQTRNKCKCNFTTLINNFFFKHLVTEKISHRSNTKTCNFI